MLVLLVALLLLYPILRDLLAWAYRPLNNLPPNRTPVANRRDVKPAGHGSSQAHPRNDVQYVATLLMLQNSLIFALQAGSGQRPF